MFTVINEAAGVLACTSAAPGGGTTVLSLSTLVCGENEEEGKEGGKDKDQEKHFPSNLLVTHNSCKQLSIKMSSIKLMDV